MIKQVSSIQDAIDNAAKTKDVKLHGWIHRERGSNKFKFIVLRDSSQIIQCVIEKEKVPEEEWELAKKLQVESSIELEGTIQEDKRAPTGYEVHVKQLTLVGNSDTYPIQKDQSREFLDDNRHLWLRSRKMTAILKIRSTVFRAIHDYFRAHNFYEYQSPILQSVQCEGGSTLFGVDFYKNKGVFLAQTWQLYAEPAIFALEKIYTIAPSFRAENSKTSRHLCEYWHAEMEQAWASFDMLIEHGEALIKAMVNSVLTHNRAELEILGRDSKDLVPTTKKKFPRMTYTDALKMLKKKEISIKWGTDLRTVEENALSELFDTPIVITHYPKQIKAFYMKEADDPSMVLGADFIAPEHYGELIGLSERESDINKLLERLEQAGENPEEYTFYLDTRKYGSVPHGGFGLGVERVISWMCKLDNIKDAIPFPRTPLRFRP